ncbi:hypothetical protein [Nocardioides convexus]|uniref:hypothetical protein n=1 Tax=Nocardioides convexus TaxID=2712224 RepID=UPI0024187FC4|nr:hypothetical protein [Nocardioides convexus]
MVDEDPEIAYQHSLAAKARAARIAVVREAVGEAAYAAGHYAEALAEPACGEADERRDGVPADHGRLPPGPGQPHPGTGAWRRARPSWASRPLPRRR